MRWIEPKYSKKRIKKAGSILVHSDISSEEYAAELPVLQNWRSSHAFPMQVMLDFLRKNALRIDKKANAVQRLKRTDSIKAKLEKEKGMSLARMEDIAGCRVVLSDVRFVNRLYEMLSRSRTKNILHRERDYLSQPKGSGYRGIHLIYRYNGRKEAFRGMATELQLRSQIQHSWATSVEVFGTFTKQALKASIGTEDWLRAFKVISVELARMEGYEPPEAYNNVDTFSEMKILVEQLSFFEHLAAFKVATKAISEHTDGAGYYIVKLELENRLVSYAHFQKNRIDDATEFYNREEEKHSGNNQVDIVMVSANSVADLRRAYPNYFMDTSVFESNLANAYNRKNLTNGS